MRYHEILRLLATAAANGRPGEKVLNIPREPRVGAAERQKRKRGCIGNLRCTPDASCFLTLKHTALLRTSEGAIFTCRRNEYGSATVIQKRWACSRGSSEAQTREWRWNKRMRKKDPGEVECSDAMSIMCVHKNIHAAKSVRIVVVVEPDDDDWKQ